MDENTAFFRPQKVASWVTVLDDILWPDIKISDRIKKRAAKFAEAGIDLAINYGFHMRFDYSDYFEQLHGYYNEVCEELHKYGIKYMDHYSCNHVQRPRTKEDFYRLHNHHRHHVLLHKDPYAAKFAQYEGHLFQNICEKRVDDSSRGYTMNYQAECFCHNNPEFLEMHKSYLTRLLRDVPMDALEIDDMCDYGSLTTCCCDHCLDRFRRDYGHELPPFEDKTFWGDTSKHPSFWGNYENPVFRDWILFKQDGIKDHLKMVKETVGDIPLVTCCSSTGPIVLNTVSLNLENMSEHLNFLMLENCGQGVNTIEWTRMDAEALQQKDIAHNMNNAPAIALSYCAYEPGAYLGWSLARYWGVANWSSTLIGRLDHDPGDIPDISELIAPCNNWEDRYSSLDLSSGEDIADVRLVNNLFCRMNGFRDENGDEQWTKVSAWSRAFVNTNVGYRFLRFDELADADRLMAEDTPLIIDNCGCVSDKQWNAIKAFLDNGGKAVLSLPFGTCDEKGFKREKPLSEEIIGKYPNVTTVTGTANDDLVRHLKKIGVIRSRITQTAGESTWALRLRKHGDKLVLHVLNRALEAIPYPGLYQAYSNLAILKDFISTADGIACSYIIDTTDLSADFKELLFKSPEIGRVQREVVIEELEDGRIELTFDPEDIKLYGIIE